MSFDVIIVGGGLAGAALAVALRRSHLKIAVLEARAPVPPQSWDQRIYAYSPASARFLEELGIWRHLEADRLTRVTDMRIFGDRGGGLHFSAYDSGLAELAWIGESSLVHLELWQSLKRQHNVELICPAQAESLQLDSDCATLRLTTGKTLRARLIVGADGRDSWVRRQTGIRAKVAPYGERGVVANFSCERNHRGTAFQWFFDEGILAWLPLPGRRMSMVWSAPDALADELLSMDEATFCARVAAAGKNLLGELELLTPRAAFPLQFMRVDEIVRPRLALIGDAAHAIHPLSGHGINLGFLDARALAETLSALPPWRDVGELDALRPYARARAEEPFVLQYATHGLNHLFRTRNPLLTLARNVGMNLTDRLPVVGNALVRYAVSGRL